MAEIKEIFLRIPKKYNEVLDRIAGSGKFPYLRMKDGFYWVPGRSIRQCIAPIMISRTP
ncbi:MAG: hypothetical protein ACMUIG_05445 [Thermoplasmatota archaeon]